MTEHFGPEIEIRRVSNGWLIRVPAYGGAASENRRMAVETTSEMLANWVKTWAEEQEVE